VVVGHVPAVQRQAQRLAPLLLLHAHRSQVTGGCRLGTTRYVGVSRLVDSPVGTRTQCRPWTRAAETRAQRVRLSILPHRPHVAPKAGLPLFWRIWRRQLDTCSCTAWPRTQGSTCCLSPHLSDWPRACMSHLPLLFLTPLCSPGDSRGDQEDCCSWSSRTQSGGLYLGLGKTRDERVNLVQGQASLDDEVILGHS
jgi:hypothetical protein